MGQRHQIYVRLPKIYYNPNNPNNKDEVTIGVHHQWLFGKTALRQLKNFLTFIKNQTEYGPFNSGDILKAVEALMSIYSIDIESGYYHSVHPLWGWKNNKQLVGKPSKECTNPLEGDNNNGITVIDLTGKKPRYCFMSLYGLECLDDSQKDNYTNLKPMSAEEYLLLHYPNYKKDKECDCESCSKDSKLKKEHDAETEEHRKLCISLVKFFKQIDLLTKKDIAKIFPKLPSKKIKK